MVPTKRRQARGVGTKPPLGSRINSPRGRLPGEGGVTIEPTAWTPGTVSATHAKTGRAHRRQSSSETSAMYCVVCNSTLSCAGFATIDAHDSGSHDQRTKPPLGSRTHGTPSAVLRMLRSDAVRPVKEGIGITGGGNAGHRLTHLVHDVDVGEASRPEVGARPRLARQQHQQQQQQ